MPTGPGGPPPTPAAGIKGGANVATASGVELDAVRRLLRARTPQDVVDVLLDVVVELGATAEPPATRSDRQLPVDITFGIGEPLVPSGEPATLHVLRDVLQPLVADAHVALDRTRRENVLVDSASNDPLTGLGNRRTAMRALSRLVEGDAVAMVDLDHFKAVNDTLGHDAGDEVLRCFGLTLGDVTRATDTVGRLGGEEFVLLLPRTTIDGAATLLDRLRQTWQETRPHPITFSAGVCPVGPDGPRAALSRADAALYAAKRGGRNRVEVAP